MSTNQVDPGVHISCRSKNGKIKSLMGIIVRDYVITLSNDMPKNRKDIMIRVKQNDNCYSFSPIKIERRKCDRLTFVLKKYFDFHENPNLPTPLSPFTAESLSTFQILYLSREELMMNDINPDSVPDCSLEPFIPSQEIIVTFVPFSHFELINFISSGIVCSTLENNSGLIMMDVKLCKDSVGAPVYRMHNSERKLSGIALCQVNTESNNHKDQLPTGFSLGIHISVFQDLLNPLCELEYLIPQHTEFLLNNSLNYVVRILHSSQYFCGIVIASDGLVMTNGHCVNYKIGIKVLVWFNDKVHYEGTVLFSSKQNSALDIAMIRINSRGVFPSCRFSAQLPKIGDVVYSVGFYSIIRNPTKFISRGLISTLIGSVIGTSTAISFLGCSGGAILSQNGEVVGLTFGYFSESPRICLNAFFPIAWILQLLYFFLQHRSPKAFRNIVQTYGQLSREAKL